MVCVPTASAEVAHCAVRLLPDPPNGIAAHPVTSAPPSLKSTAPVGALPFTVAVKVTAMPLVDGLMLLATAVVVGVGPPLPPPAAATAAPASRMPAPHSAVVQLHATCAGGLVHAG